MNFSVNKINNVAGVRRTLLASVAVVATQGAAMAQSDEAKVYSIPPSDVGNALQAYSEQADVEIIYAEGDVEGKTTDGVDGEYSREAALEEIINDADLTYEVNDDGVVVIRSSFLDLKQASARAPEVRVARASYSTAAQDTETIALEAERFDEGDGEDFRDEVIVTGTNIRGIDPESSPTRSFSREDIMNSGAATAQDFIKTLPLNFGGGSNDNIRVLPNDPNANFNAGNTGGLGSSVNLRGLGSGSTLVLLNGRRIAPSSGLGDFVDISMIPASAIERVEILTDGASSIYGADAVAGVVNFVLRDDFDGAEASFRYGTVTEGDHDEYRAGITLGKNWGSGNGLIAYEFFDQENLSAGDRSFSQSAPLPNDLRPAQERHSILASGSQQLTPKLEVFGDASYSTREANSEATIFIFNIFSNPKSENLNLSSGVSWEISDTWDATFSGGYSSVNIEANQTGSLGEGATDIDSKIWTADALASGELFELPAGELRVAVGGHFRTESFESIITLGGGGNRSADRDVYSVFGEAFVPVIGPENAIKGFERLELNVSGRFEDYSDFGTTVNPKVGILWQPTESIRFRGSYSTSFNPPPLGRVGAADTRVTVQRTSDQFSGLGLTVPADVVVVLVAGTDNNLDAESSRSFTAGLDFDQDWGRNNLTIKATWFDIRFDGRLGGTPIPGGLDTRAAPIIAFDNPELLPGGTVIFAPSLSDINAVLDSVEAPGAVLADPLDAEIINFAPVIRNLAVTEVQGFDFNAAYNHEFDAGVLSLGFDVSYLLDFQQQASETTDSVDRLDTLFNPVSLNLRGHAGFSSNGISANVFVNYTDDYRTDNTDSGVKIDSWTTVDLSFSYDTGDSFRSPVLDNTILRLSVRNLFNEEPPSVPSNNVFGIFGYDVTNASPVNRFISFELTKRF